ncbi:beta strand repeat-containing protein [Brevundimonas subvibrioides]|uniref:beta strand repeat-containing protein n=1 Tax=Brevundimonas subvibrioides TaxID=74313 RepID=UPI0022B5ABDC|nr:calcium-binding protein [Brevundimonas subvibrioides]
MPTITGTSQADTLVGTNQGDLVQGLDGNDILNGGPAGDAPDYDVLDGGPGTDTLRAGDDASGARSGQAVRVDLVTGTATYFYPSLNQTWDTDTLVSIENVTGTSLGDTLQGDGGANRLEGLAGNDALEGREGDDVLLGGAGNDRLIGGTGLDLMTGGVGDDTYEVTDVGDQVIEGSGEGTDIVYSYLDSYTLATNVEHLVLVGPAREAIGNGLNNLIYGNDGSNVLDGGAGADALTGGAGDDTYVVDNVGDAVDERNGDGVDTVVSGIDSYALAANVENLTLTGAARAGTGNSQANVIIGNGLGNALAGGGGDDTLNGGGGDDSLDGGDGLDVAVFAGARSAYTIATVQGRTTVTGPDGVDTLTGVERLQFADQVVVLSTILTGTGSAETLTGTAESDTLYGLGGGDTLLGLGGDDFLDGGAGADLLVGGDGDDILFGGIGTPGIFNPTYENDVLNGGAGIDTFRAGYEEDRNASVVVRLVDGTAAYRHSGVLGSVQTETDTLVSVENVTGTAGADDIEGDAGANRLEGGANGDRLAGLAGDDFLIGGAGNDTLEGGDGIDTAVYAGARSAYTVTTSGGVTTVSGPDGTDTLRGMERLQFSDLTVSITGSPDETLYGDNGANVIHGYDGNDTIYGLGFTDTLYGDEGDDILIGGGDYDTMIGGTGNDAYEVTEAYDVVVEALDEGTDVVFTYVDRYTLAANVEVLALVGGAQVGFGNALDNTLVGNALGNTLIGGGGADTMIGGVGNDVYEVTEAGDGVVENAGEGTDTVFSYLDSYTLTANVETLALVGAARLGIGNAGNNTLIGTTGNNTLIGGSGVDTMIGGAGNDAYEVTEAGDILIENVGEGFDSAYSYLDSYALANNVELLALVGSARAGIGNGLDNTLVGNALDNTLIGGTGNDTLIGGAGNDVYEVTEAGDAVIENAGEGGDTVFSYLDAYGLTANVETLALVGSARIGLGNAGDNTLIGNAGANVLNGNGGNDVLVGGAGADTFWHLGAAAGHDRITDFQTAGEVIVLDASIYANFAAVQARATQVGANVVITLSASTSLTLDNVQLGQLTAANFAFYGAPATSPVEPLDDTSPKVAGLHIWDPTAVWHDGPTLPHDAALPWMPTHIQDHWI